MLSKSFINTFLENVLFCSQIIHHYLGCFLRRGVSPIWLLHKCKDTTLLSPYDYTLKYRSGAENSNADFFSRFPSNEKTTTSSIKSKIFMTELSYSPVTSKKVADFSKKDPANVTDCFKWMAKQSSRTIQTLFILKK